MKKHSKKSSKKKRKKLLEIFSGIILLLLGIILILFIMPERKILASKKIENLLKKENIQFEKIIEEEKVKIYHIFTSFKVQKFLKEKIFNSTKNDILEEKSLKEREEDLETIEIISLKSKNENIILYFFSKKEKEVPKRIAKKKARVLIVMDDLGYNIEPLSWFSRKKFPIVLSFLPGLPHSKTVSEKLYSQGYEILLHIPMEPINISQIKSEKDTILLSMENFEIEEKISNFLKEIPYAIGVNNHMGSAYTSDFKKMVSFMEILKKHKLFFLDSRTTPETKGFEAARGVGLKFFERDVFLDNILEKSYIKRQFEVLLQKASAKGYGIAICHPNPQTLKILEELIPYFTSKAEFVGFSQLILEN